MKEQKNNGRGIFYGVIGVATLVVAIIGATFAYFTATATNATNITGNMASVSFGLDVHKVTTADEKLGGMIPMSNSMVEAALNGKDDSTVDTAGPKICVDDNGNAVCQIYKISVTNQGTAGMFLDGYVALTGGSGVSTDYTTATNKTTMRWAQVFCSTGEDGKLSGCTTAGKTTTRSTTDAKNVAGIDTNWNAIHETGTEVNENSGFNKAQILDSFSDITKKGKYQGNEYDIINTNYIRVSDHALQNPGSADAKESFKRDEDVTSALVFNQRIDPKGTKTSSGETAAVPTATTSNSSSSYTDGQVYYIVVWLSENGKNQTADATNGSTDPGAVPATTDSFFKGTVTFISAQGSEVTATFSGYASVQSDQVKKQGQS